MVCAVPRLQFGGFCSIFNFYFLCMCVVLFCFLYSEEFYSIVFLFFEKELKAGWVRRERESEKTWGRRIFKISLNLDFYLNNRNVLQNKI